MRVSLPIIFATMLIPGTTLLAVPSANLEANVSAPREVRAGELFQWTASVTNLGPDSASQVTLSSSLYPQGAPCEILIPELAAGSSRTITCQGTPFAPPYDWSVSASVSSATSDPDVSNDTFGLLLNVLTDPDLAIGMGTGSPLDPGLPFDLIVTVVNLSWVPAGNVSFLAEVPRAVRFMDLPESCRLVGDKSVRCEIGSVPAREDQFSPSVRRLVLHAVAPDDPSGSEITGTAEVTLGSPDNDPSNNSSEFRSVMFRTFYVTRTADEGGGSLRAAIEEANGVCGAEDPCKIAFRIQPSDERPWQTITIDRALPTVGGSNVRIDGTTQTKFFGDTNPLGPEIEIRGGFLEGPGNGIVLDSRCTTELRGLAINGFPGAAVVGAGDDQCALNGAPAWGERHSITECYIGTDPTGMTAVPNLRGIVIQYGNTQFSGYPLFPGIGAYEVTDNLVSGNLRSGVFSVTGTRIISGNRIGLNRDISAGLGNGASGVYIGPLSHGTDVNDNFIGFNHDFGIAVDRHTQYVAFRGNSIQANWQGGIDIGLDGVTTAIDQSPDNDLQLPVITTARWDPAGEVTVVEGRLPQPGFALLGYLITLYANDAPDPSGYGEGQYALGSAKVDDRGNFVFLVQADLRGKWVSATATRTHFVGFAKPVSPSGSSEGFLSTTTEFSRSVEVR